MLEELIKDKSWSKSLRHDVVKVVELSPGQSVQKGVHLVTGAPSGGCEVRMAYKEEEHLPRRKVPSLVGGSRLLIVGLLLRSFWVVSPSSLPFHRSCVGGTLPSLSGIPLLRRASLCSPFSVGGPCQCNWMKLNHMVSFFVFFVNKFSQTPSPSPSCCG